MTQKEKELITEIEPEDIEDLEPPEDIIECGTDLDDDLPDTDDIEDENEEIEDNPDIIYCYE